MTIKLNYTAGATSAPEPVAATKTPATATIEQTNLDAVFLGRGVPRPFRRDQKSDYVNVSGTPLVDAAIGQIIGTHAQTGRSHGELPWRPEFGSRVHTLRHAPNNAALDDVATAYVAQAIDRWDGRIGVSRSSVERSASESGSGENTLTIRTQYAINTRQTASGVIQNTQTTTVNV